MTEFNFPTDVAIGGCGRAELPLALAFADRGLNVLINDVNRAPIRSVKGGVMPFIEPGENEIPPRVLASRFVAPSDPSLIRGSEIIVIVIGKSVDEHLNVDVMAVPNVVHQLPA